MANLALLVEELLKKPTETEWLEFKLNNTNPETIGENVCAISNSATLHNHNYGYIIWGVDEDTHKILGTTFDWRKSRIGGEELESWLRHNLSENANFHFESTNIFEKNIVVLQIYKAINSTVKFKNIEYIRIGSYTKPLNKYPEIEKQIWNRINSAKFEDMYAKQDLTQNDIINAFDYISYFDLLNKPIPDNAEGIVFYLAEEKMVEKQDDGLFAITNLGALLFSKRIRDFDTVSRKSVRIIQYNGNDRTDTIREVTGQSGYASKFENMIEYILGLLPAKEEISGGLRKVEMLYPQIVLRELIANALIHQDLSITGAGPMIEIFNGRVEITNPGTPLIDTKRIIDVPPRSRNEKLSGFMHRVNICEERGSGWDKVEKFCEQNRLPAPVINIYEDSTRVILKGIQTFKDIPLVEKIWSCYMHACLKQVSGERMSNSSLRDRFGVPESNSAAISKLMKMTEDEGLIKKFDPYTAPRYMSYVPFWA